MANAKRCDKCGNFYIVNSIYQNLCVQKRRGLSWNELDLCDNCFKELREFLGFYDIEKEKEREQ